MGEGIKIRNQKIALVFVFICSWSYLLLAGQGHIKDLCVMLTNPRVIVIFWCFRLVYLKMRDYLSVFPNFYYDCTSTSEFHVTSWTLSPEAITKLPKLWRMCWCRIFLSFKWVGFSSLLLSQINEDPKSFCLHGLFRYSLHSKLKLKSSKITASLLHVNKRNVLYEK